MSCLEDNIQRLINQGKIENEVILWGIGKQTDEVIDCLHEKGIRILFIIDNFKSLFWHTYHNIVVADSKILELARSEAINFAKKYDIKNFPLLESSKGLNFDGDIFNS